MPTPEQTHWIILAGGQASRMGGNDKGLIELAGQPFIQHVIDILAPQTSHISINANRNQDIYRQYGDVFGDSIENYPGPLGGMHAALHHINNDWIGFVPCDCPQLPHDLVARMATACQPDTDIAVAHNGEHIQPVVTLLHRRILPKLEAFLANGDRKIILLYRQCNMITVDFSDQADAFINLNTPEELSQFGVRHESN
ncbi:molybdopterin-guanine dinucleotide biosynthesis protein A [Photobacterium kishitanii]|uniref:Molybdenum cofactor guanylyltransferase n=1 Tax=Photobacterium kishitanii TaxID=318456 RepID=A0AAX0YUV4_9GAMM|nr:molybdenum cofactor guanylyltransferase MobA [Photobacterium kishitanii]KJG58969.1 molybdopterin-guanine dinucleotide biosynthesis protein A [Photobacterium kishitanii]KJG62103.1 molybdopterin-guanine dinucleotide biosynthesis protein A [Photobacterium kishitanii]KJG67166.1 molybdopterin-guanine dinucleotide biosynthesis protein A [Photobacterium kishitanii]KJG70589.1 molybdopterin-guanine dinucleotide biosynthesis protein A [Photobacterium kishitanii]PSX20840.1 molybdenum cofactor guanylyl